LRQKTVAVTALAPDAVAISIKRVRVRTFNPYLAVRAVARLQSRTTTCCAAPDRSRAHARA